MPNGKFPWTARTAGVADEGLNPDGFGSTEAEMTELVMLPAMRPACSRRSGRMARRKVDDGFTWGSVIVGGGVPKKTPLPAARSAVGGKLVVREQALRIAGLDVGVLDLATDEQVLDRPAYRDRRIGRVPVGPQRRDREAIDRHVVHAQAEGDVPRAGGRHQHHVVGLAADEEVADLRIQLRPDGRRAQGISVDQGGEIRRVAADPHVADLAGRRPRWPAR